MTDLRGDTSAAIGFLKQWRANGPWQLTAIQKDEHRIETRTFCPSDEAEHNAWIEARQGRMNLYFTVNPLLQGRSPNKKPAKQDVKEVAWLHVDIDPRAGETIETEKRRALDALEAFDPPPTAIIDSGGGVQAFWKLAEPLPIDGDAERAAREAESYNRALEQHFGADHCHNSDRIMRLPGSINVPDAGKRKRGRTHALARLLSFYPDRVYEISRFAKATVLPALGHDHLTPVAPRISLEALPESVRPLVMVDVPQGERSERLFAALCAMAREGVPREQMLAVITDRKFPVSASVLDKPRPAVYAARQVENAYVAIEEPEIARLNQEYAVIRIKGNTKILRWDSVPLYEDGPRFRVPEFSNAESFKLFLANQWKTIAVGSDTKQIALAEHWIRHRARRTYHGIEFAPGAEPEITVDEQTRLNLWSGWGVEPQAGNWSRMRYHIEHVLADGDNIAAEYILHWTAWTFQNPHKRAEVALVFRGGKGIGKSTFGVALCRLFGAHAMHVSDRRDLVGNFNAHMMQCALLFADEALWPGHKEDDGPLKRLITEPTLSIEPKGVDKFSVPNHLHVIIGGNADWLVPATADERRFAVFNVSERHRVDRDYFEALYHEMNHGGLPAMLHDLLNLDLGGWHPRDDIPDTKGLRDQKERSMGSEDQWIVDLLTTGVLPGSRPTRRNWARSKELFEHARESVPRLRNMSDHQLATIVKRWGAASRASGGCGWEFPALGEMRKRWNERQPKREFDAREDWDAPESEPCLAGDVF